jgi:hypothetical protein
MVSTEAVLCLVFFVLCQHRDMLCACLRTGAHTIAAVQRTVQASCCEDSVVYCVCVFCVFVAWEEPAVVFQGFETDCLLLLV